VARVASKGIAAGQRSRRGKTIFLSSHMLSRDRTDLRPGRVHGEGKRSPAGQKPPSCWRDHNLAEIEFKNVAPDALTALGFSAPAPIAETERIVQRCGASEQRRLIESIWQSGGDVVSVKPRRRRSLEELFVKLAEKKDRSDGVRAYHPHRGESLSRAAHPAFTDAGLRDRGRRPPSSFCRTRPEGRRRHLLDQAARGVCRLAGCSPGLQTAIHNERRSKRIPGRSFPRESPAVSILQACCWVA